MVAAGAADGTVSLYSLAGVAGGPQAPPGSPEEQRARLEAALRAHTAQAVAD